MKQWDYFSYVLQSTFRIVLLMLRAQRPVRQVLHLAAHLPVIKNNNNKKKNRRIKRIYGAFWANLLADSFNPDKCSMEKATVRTSKYQTGWVFWAPAEWVHHESCISQFCGQGCRAGNCSLAADS